MLTLYETLREVHIVTGAAGLLSGFVAMAARKGSPVHARAGVVFVGTMLAMAATGAFIAYFLRPNRGNVMGGLVTMYLVLTAWLAAWRPPARVGRLEWLGAGIGALTAAVGFAWARAASAAGSGRLDGYPPALFTIFGGLALLGVLLDLRVLRRGGVAGVQRTTRHLWRMCVALLIAAASFFLGQAKVFPAAIRKPPLLAIPVLLVLVTMLWWLWRTRSRRRAAAVVAEQATGTVAVRP